MAQMSPANTPVTPTLATMLSGYGRRVPDWVTAYAYVVGELVVNAGTIYRCTTAHTSGDSFDGSKFAGTITTIDGGTL